MPLYVYQAAYTAESLAAQLKKPENRVEAVGRATCEAVGGKLVGGWYCFGDYDLALVADVPNNESMETDQPPTGLLCSRIYTRENSCGPVFQHDIPDSQYFDRRIRGGIIRYFDLICLDLSMIDERCDVVVPAQPAPFKRDWNGRSLTDNAPDVMFLIATNSPVRLGMGKESMTSEPSKYFPYGPIETESRNR
jgi:hypothetical protein